jgi:hypothetical protein
VAGAKGGAVMLPTPPAWLARAGANLARTARVATPGATAGGLQTAALLNDGNGRIDDNSARWVNRAPLPHWVEFAWDQPVRVGAARIISGYQHGGVVDSPVQGFRLQWHDGSGWRDIPGSEVRNNRQVDWSGTFGTVETRRLRLGVTATKDDTSRLWEVELYAPVDPAGR